ncbi:SusC/RagA family TonB-linked outer membrane protein [Labilibaculum antarcticum]|uniref:SusC/RagA family TonB-linked outer membrane protein n=2 Tax=Labilibaculum antarcticum TaxID=1717717 RepID=A0A1Y1CQ57_9BACT|nr:SusC/RagA family TonB-linked outer membrane protein [Labilibaculum antarcticum]
MLLLIGGSVNAQQLTVIGRVTDQSGLSIPGVNIVVKGTTNGTVTDIDGNYSINVESKDVLLFSFIGFTNQEFIVGSKSTIDAVMVEESIGMNEVVVVGYGTQKKANLTGAVSSVDFGNLETRPAANTATLLQGQMSGVTVSNFSNQPGEDNPQIRIRGIGTLNAGQEPLVIVDGIESSLSQIPAADIESLSVLKDAASAAIYGVRAANGVIVVTTKQGKSGKPKVSLRQSFAWQQAIVEPSFVDSWDFATLQNLDLTEQGQDALYTEEQIQTMRDGADPDRWANTNWFNEMYRTAPMNTTYLSVSGSKENVHYMFSGEYLDQEGIMIKTGQKRYNFRSNISVDISDRVTIGINLSGNKRDIEATLNSASSSNNGDDDLNYIIRRFANPTIPVKYTDGNWGQVNGLYYLPGSTVGGIKNPVEFANRGENTTEKYNFTGKLFADVEVLKNLHFKPNFSYVYNSSLLSKFTPTYETYDLEGNVINENVHNKLINNNQTTKRYQFENLLTYNVTLNEKHKIGVLAGQSAQLYRLDFFEASVEDFPNNNIHELSGGINNKDVTGNARELALNSFFGRVNYNFADKYLIEANYRYDGTSRMSSDNRWGGFPSVSAGWVASNENFLSDFGPVSFLKVRGSWGQLGNENIGGSNFYPYAQTIATGQNYLWGNDIAPGVSVTSLANSNLTWETTTITDIGVDLNLFNNKVQIVADWFDKTSSDILIRLPIPSTLGNVSAPFQNIGEVKNTGWEIDVKMNQTFGDFNVFGGFNLTHVKNEVTNYGGLESINNNSITKKGEAISSYYAFIADGYYQSQEELNNAPTQFGKPLRLGDVKYRDISGPDGIPDGKISDDYDRTIIGNQFPKLQYSFNLGASYKGFDVYAFFQGISGIDRYYWYNTETSGTFTEVAKDYWTEDNRNAPTPRWGNLGNNTKYSTFWLKDASYLRLKNLEIGYTIPSELTKKVHIENARIYFSGINLWTKTDVEDYDPEKLTGDDRNRDYPQSKIYSMGVNITF